MRSAREKDAAIVHEFKYYVDQELSMVVWREQNTERVLSALENGMTGNPKSNSRQMLFGSIKKQRK